MNDYLVLVYHLIILDIFIFIYSLFNKALDFWCFPKSHPTSVIFKFHLYLSISVEHSNKYDIQNVVRE